MLLRERDVRLRLPSRFGAVTLTEATEAFARVRVTLKDGRSAWGQAAEMLAPKWFHKNPARSNADNAEQLGAALRLARTLYDRAVLEKNGHHYVNGMPDRPAAEQRRLLEAHPDLYTAGDPVRLRIERGRVTIHSLDRAGFATAAEPDGESMRETAS